MKNQKPYQDNNEIRKEEENFDEDCINEEHGQYEDMDMMEEAGIMQEEQIANEHIHQEYSNNQKEPIYVMSLELEEGNTVNINIYNDSDPRELAYYFCEKYNLDENSLNYLINEIENLLVQYRYKTTQPEIIEEDDEQNEGTIIKTDENINKTEPNKNSGYINTQENNIRSESDREEYENNNGENYPRISPDMLDEENDLSLNNEHEYEYNKNIDDQVPGNEMGNIIDENNQFIESIEKVEKDELIDINPISNSEDHIEGMENVDDDNEEAFNNSNNKFMNDMRFSSNSNNNNNNNYNEEEEEEEEENLGEIDKLIKSHAKFEKKNVVDGKHSQKVRFDTNENNNTEHRGNTDNSGSYNNNVRQHSNTGSRHNYHSNNISNIGAAKTTYLLPSPEKNVFDRLYNKSITKRKIPLNIAMNLNMKTYEKETKEERKINYGELLYLRGKLDKEQKMKRVVKIRNEMEIKEDEHLTFSPKISNYDNSNIKRKDLYNPKNHHMNKQKNIEHLRLEKENKYCSFQPEINK
jgi:hypothetical protein